MSKHTELTKQLLNESGVKNASETLTVRQWVRWLKDHSDNAVKNVGWSLEWAVKTGRVPNVNRENELLDVQSCKPLSNRQVVNVLAKAVVSQSANNQAEGCKALQGAMGLRVA